MSIQTLNPKLLDSYEAMLKESIDHFLAEFHRGSADFSDLGPIFFRLIQTMTDPPLEFIWFYSAVTFHSSKSTLQDSSMEILIAKDMFQSIVSFSSPSNGLKKVSVLAPLLYELYNILCDFPSLRREVEGLVESIVSYISICCCDDLAEQGVGFDKSRMCFLNLVPVWTMDRVLANCAYGDDLKLFFPLLSDDLRCGVNVDCKMGHLAGVVMIEAFLLSLSLKFGLGISRKQLQKEVLSSAAQIIKGFQKNWAFIDMLLRLLLEPSLPVANLLTSVDEVLLKKVLFDSVLLEEGSFLSPSTFPQPPDNHFKDLVLMWLFAADTAMHFVRQNGYLTRAICYLDAFSESHLTSQLIKWVTNQSNVEEKLTIPNTSTPKALIKWLLVLENQGVKVFDVSISELHAKASKLRVDNELPASKPEGESPCEKTLSNIGNEGKEENKVCGDQQMVDSLDGDTFSAAVCMDNSTSNHGRRKREEGITDEEVKRQIKLVKYSFHENSVDDGLSSGSEVENPAHGLSSGSEVGYLASDEEMEDMNL